MRMRLLEFDISFPNWKTDFFSLQKMDAAPPPASVVVGTYCLSDYLFVGTNGYVAAVHQVTGEELWRVSLPVTLAPGPACTLLDFDQLFVGTAGRIFSLDPATGRTLWHNDLEGLRYDIVAITTNRRAGAKKKVADEGAAARLVFIGTYGYVVALDVGTGQERWRLSLPSTGYNLVTMIWDGDRLIVASYGKVMAIDAAEGAIVWRNELSGMGYHHSCLAMVGASSNSGADPLPHYALMRDRQRAAAAR